MSYGRTDRESSTRSTASGVAENVKTASGLSIVAGIWMVVAPFILRYTDLHSTMWNSIVVGILVMAMAAYRVANPYLNSWVSWVVAILGVWMVLSPFVYGHANFATPLWNDILVGIVVAILGAWSAVSSEGLGTSGPGTTRPTS